MALSMVYLRSLALAVSTDNRFSSQSASVLLLCQMQLWQRGHFWTICILFCIVKRRSVLFNLLCVCLSALSSLFLIPPPSPIAFFLAPVAPAVYVTCGWRHSLCIWRDNVDNGACLTAAVSGEDVTKGLLAISSPKSSSWRADISFSSASQWGAADTEIKHGAYRVSH